MRRGLVLAMEEEGMAEVEEGAVDALQAEVTDDIMESSEETASIESMVVAIEEAVEDTETLGDIQEVVADSVETGEGIPPAAAEVAEIAVEAICARLGIVGQRVIPSMESFGSANSRVAASRIAMEGIGEQLKKIWEAIKKAFQTVWTKIKDWFAKFFANTDKVKKLVESVRAEVDGIGGKTMKNKEFDNGSIAKAFADNKGKHDVSVTKAILDNHVAVTKESLNAFKIIKDLAMKMNAFVAKPDAGKIDQFQSDITGIVNELSKGSSFKSNKGGDNTMVGPYVGSSFIELDYKSVNKKPSVKMTITAGAEVTSKKVKTLSQPEMYELCDKAKDIMKVTEEYKQKQNEIDDVNKAFVKLTDTAISFTSKMSDAADTNADTREGLTAARVLSSDLNALTSRLITMVPAFNVKASKMAMSYVRASISQFEDKASK